MDGYNRRKYVLKLLYIFMLGYEVDFGYMEALALQSSEKFSEKQIVEYFLSLLASALLIFLSFLL
jgi:AP-2 complex subunit alpha